MENNTLFTSEKAEDTSVVKVQPQEMEFLPAEKQAGWLKLANSFYAAEAELKELVDNAMGEYCLPTKAEEIPGSEKFLKTLVSARVDVEEKRKKITSRFKDLADRLMVPEKSLLEPIDTLTKEIIKLKKENEAVMAKEKQRTEDFRRLAEAVIKNNADNDAKVKLFISELLSKAFTFAMDKRIVPAEINAYVKKCAESGVKKIMEFKLTGISFTPMVIGSKEIAEAIANNPFFLEGYANTFDFEMKNKFSDYEVAFVNAKEALIKEGNDRAEAEKKIEAEKMTANISASIQAHATPLDAMPTIATKALKKVYKVSVEESFESMVNIFAAFLANKDLCLRYTTAKKWLAFTASSAALCLEKAKNEDNAFQPAGIKFVEVDKL